MNKLLADVIDAHGGLERWKRFATVAADVVSGGELLDLKSPQVPEKRRITAHMQEQQSSITLAENSDRRSVFRPDRVALETLDGRLLADLYNPRETFSGHNLSTPWTPFQRGYFGGYALWSYLTTPFSISMKDVQVWEIDPLEVDGEVWRGLRVVMPDRIATHSRAQEFFFGNDMLLRRQDYTLDITDGFRAANFALDIVEVEGLKLPSKRRAYMCNKNYEVLPDRLMIWIDFSGISFQ